MYKKGFIFFMLLVVSLHNQAMLNHGLKKMAVKSMSCNTAAIRSMSSEKKSTEIKAYQVVLGCCAVIHCSSEVVTAFVAVSQLRQESERNKHLECSEDYCDHKNKNKHQK